MATSVDMSLDDIIKKNRERGGRRGRAHRGRGLGRTFNGGRAFNGERTFNGGRTMAAARRGPLSVNARSAQYAIAKPSRRIRSLPWQHDLLEDSIRAAGITGVEVGTKLYISNLDYGVSNEDIRELFSEIGELKRYAVHYERSGHSTGSAEVVYTRRSDAFAALKKYNNVLLDGKPMKIEIVGATAHMPPISARVNVTGVNGRRKRTVVMTSGPGHAKGSAPRSRGPGSGPGHAKGSAPRSRGPGRGGLRNGHGSSRGQGRGRGWGRVHGKRQVDKSAGELDKELENYHAEAMQS